MIFISTWSSSTLSAILQMGDITCQTQSLRFEQSAQSQSQWRWGPGWIWKFWKKKSCSCQLPCWKQPDNHVHWDPTSPLSLSFCSTPVVPNDFPTCNFVKQPFLKHINVSSSKAIFLCFSNRKFNILSETKAQQRQSNKETFNKIAFTLSGTTKKNDNKWNSSQCNEGYEDQDWNHPFLEIEACLLLFRFPDPDYFQVKPFIGHIVSWWRGKFLYSNSRNDATPFFAIITQRNHTYGTPPGVKPILNVFGNRSHWCFNRWFTLSCIFTGKWRRCTIAGITVHRRNSTIQALNIFFFNIKFACLTRELLKLYWAHSETSKITKNNIAHFA